MEEGFPHMGTGPEVPRRRALLEGEASKGRPCSPQPSRPWQLAHGSQVENAHSPEDTQARPHPTLPAPHSSHRQ